MWSFLLGLHHYSGRYTGLAGTYTSYSVRGKARYLIYHYMIQVRGREGKPVKKKINLELEL